MSRRVPANPATWAFCPSAEEPIGDAALVEDLDGARVQAARARADEVLARASLDDDHVRPRQGQLARQHQPRRAAAGDHHRVLGHRRTSIRARASRAHAGRSVAADTSYAGTAAAARAHRRAGAAVALGDDLGQDRERGLGRRATAEVEPDRPAQPRELAPRSRPASSRRAATVGLGLARPDRADVPAAAPERLDDRRLVELDVVGEDRDRVVRAEADLVGDLVRPADDEPIDVGEALPCRERGPAVDDDRLVAQLAARAGPATGRSRRRRRRRGAAGPGRPR